MATVSICILIFYFSHQTGEQSSQISDSIIIRKMGHFLEYAALGFFTTSFLSNLYCVFKNKMKCFFISFIFVFLYACSDEIHQTFIPNRSGNFIDVIIDSVGGVIGILVSIKIKKYIVKNKKTK
ncbi:VanZ family protein [Gemella palaticanis]|uniref:VanZ family protein n=2 Tax=Gemelliphila palaticanis TaxID=81950 RepID=A0ABX2T2M4_9BACL|nr:VanZ family protein [Gemella palaticanis]MBF0715779.1 VanZ family protein [Gemella palaticanis]NYS47709.1 VanZ family protein [Gemella palaticanis]